MQANLQATQILSFEGHVPSIDPSVWLAPGVTLIGDVTLGPESNIWYGSVLRADVNAIRIGARSNIQDCSILHVTSKGFMTEVGDEVSVGHRAVVHGCRVGDGALIGIGASVLDGAVVGEGALVGAGAVVTPGVEIPARSLAVGIPARVVRRLDDAEYAQQRQRALNYVALARQHAAAESQSR
jgi:carbonic anhydrase/acetyltransferase-like protein (isoleucine patch superfamily)